MRKVLESQARTAAEAIQQALQRLGVPEAEVSIEVLDEGVDSPLCQRPASVRVTHDLAAARGAVAGNLPGIAVQEPRRAPVADRSRSPVHDAPPSLPRESSRVSDQGPRRSSDHDLDRPPLRESSRVSDREPRRSVDHDLDRPPLRDSSRVSDREPRRSSDHDRDRPQPRESSRLADRDSRRTSDHDRDRPQPRESSRGSVQTPRRGADHDLDRPQPRESSRASSVRDPRRPVAVATPPGAIEEARGVVAQILRLLDIDAKVEAFEDDDRIQVSIESDAGGLLIGKNGKNIDAFQHIVNRIVNRGNRDRATVVLDTEDYRRRRRESLEDLAFKVADRVRDSGRRVMLQEMNPHDRRIVHLALRDDPDVETESDGEGFLKRIYVQPIATSRPSSRARGERRSSR